jgi:hypothetical protein
MDDGNNEYGRWIDAVKRITGRAGAEFSPFA